ncbi:hypothetical protein ACP70R_025734 [Stipagrostis hirtigluma subsp. patula]
MEAERVVEEVVVTMEAGTTQEGWETPTREDCLIPVVRPCPPAPPRKRAVALPPELVGGKRRAYFQPPDLESLFVLAPQRRRASTCA